MKKSGLLLSCLATVAFAANAVELTPEQALQRAMASGPQKISAKGTSAQAPQLVYTSTFDQLPTAYVFSNNGKGYMVLSADDVAMPVLGYSDNGSFDAESIPASLQYWLEMYGKEIAAARKAGIASAPVSRAQEFAPIEPMCKTLWDQDAPYNDMCPKIGSKNTMTGCVATAMAQVMKYHNYPEVGQGTVSNSNVNLQIDLADYPLDWANMLNVYGNSATDVEKAAVAQLMYVCGMSVNMKYGTDQSGAVTNLVAVALVNNFKYDKSCYYGYRDNYTLSQWQQIIYDNLSTCGPVVYGGFTANNEGHCWVCDGYSSDGYFHFNWGWSGTSDGYYLMTALDPLSQGIGGASDIGAFDYGQEAILNISKPREDSQYVEQIYSQASITINNNLTSTSTLGRSVSVQGQFFNGSVITLRGNFGLKVTNSSGISTFYKGDGFMLSPCYGTTSYSLYLPNKLDEGVYTVHPAWTDSNGVVHDILLPVHGVVSYTMTVEGNKCAFTPNYEEGTAVISDVKLTSDPALVGESITFNANVANNSEYEYQTTICAALYPQGSNPQSGNIPLYTGASSLLIVEAGQTIEWSYSTAFSTSALGDFVMCFVNPQTYEVYSEPIEISITEPVINCELRVDNFIVNGGRDEIIDPKNIDFQFDIECLSGTTTGPFTIALFLGSHTTWATSYSFNLPLKEGDHYNIKLVLSYPEAQLGRTYKAYLYEGVAISSPVLAGPLSFKYVEEYTGITDIEDDCDAISVEYYNLQGQKADASAAGVYVKVSRMADGSVRTQKIIVK